MTEQTPRFGDKVRNPWTEPDNPLHLSTFVRVVHRNGRMNPGTWWEVTDGKGRFWQLKAEDSELIPQPLAGAVPDTGHRTAASVEPVCKCGHPSHQHLNGWDFCKAPFEYLGPRCGCMRYTAAASASPSGDTGQEARDA